MIPFDFDYYRPDTVEEAVSAFSRLDAEGKNPAYYGGGSELISMYRDPNIRAILPTRGGVGVEGILPYLD